jgi:hypothetical protein
MRGTIGTGAILLAAWADGTAWQPAIAQARPGNLPLVISATGSVHTPADKITVFVTISDAAETDAAAKAHVAEKIARLRAAAVAAGAPAAAITENTGPRSLAFVGNEAYDPDEPQLAAQGRHMAMSWLRIALDNAATYSTVRKILADQGLDTNTPAAFELKDDTAHTRWPLRTPSARRVRKPRSTLPPWDIA